jgi:DNA-directed RNA polymerase specialized sigma24 family protein
MEYTKVKLSKYRNDLAEIVLLKFFGGLNASEIADIYSIDRKTVQRKLVDAKTHLKKILEV